MPTEPPANGQKPEKLTLSVVAFHLDTIDAVHIAARQSPRGQERTRRGDLDRPGRPEELEGEADRLRADRRRLLPVRLLRRDARS